MTTTVTISVNGDYVAQVTCNKNASGVREDGSQFWLHAGDEYFLLNGEEKQFFINSETNIHVTELSKEQFENRLGASKNIQTVGNQSATRI